MKVLTFSFYKQADQKDCDSTCLKIVAKHYKRQLQYKISFREGRHILECL